MKKDKTDFINCRKCHRLTGVNEHLRCESCGEYVCLHCGCTETTACLTKGVPCGWSRRGVCTACEPAQRMAA